MSSTVVLARPDGPMSPLKRQLEQLLVAIKAAAKQPEPSSLAESAGRVKELATQLPGSHASRALRHIQHVLDQRAEAHQLLAALHQAVEAMMEIVEGRAPAGRPDWVTDELVERTLEVWQQQYTNLELVLLTPQDALEMIGSMSAALDPVRQP
jgi:hypothetical protein